MMGLKQLLIIPILYGATNSLFSLIGAGIIVVFSFLNIVFRRFWNDDKSVIFGIIFTGFLSSMVYEYGKIINYKWSMDNRMFLYTLPIIPIVLLEYKEFEFRPLLKELMVYVDAFIFIGVIKELMTKGTILGISVFSGFDGLLLFNNNSGTLLLIGLTMIISEMIKKRGVK